jgi:hypothetical protein
VSRSALPLSKIAVSPSELPRRAADVCPYRVGRRSADPPLGVNPLATGETVALALRSAPNCALPNETLVRPFVTAVRNYREKLSRIRDNAV